MAFGGDCVMVPMDVGSFDFHAVERAIETLGWSGEEMGLHIFRPPLGFWPFRF
ncbi:MAG: hypothetical protein ACLTSX_09855 [Collinsella sp.]